MQLMTYSTAKSFKYYSKISVMKSVIGEIFRFALLWEIFQQEV
jgi:hypothetical protein